MDNSTSCALPSSEAFVAAILGEDNSASATAFAAHILYEYDPDQPRDERGRWTTGGSHSDLPSAIGYDVPDASPTDGTEDPARSSEAERQQRATDWLDDGGSNAVSQMSASQFYDSWKAGKLPPVVVFNSDDRMTKELRADIAMDKARKILSARIIGDYVGHGGGDQNWPTQTLQDLPLGGARDYGTVGTLYKDFSDIFNNSTPGYVGSFSVSGLPEDVQVSYSKGMAHVTALVHFEAYNVMHILSRNKYFAAGSERAATTVWSNNLTPFTPESNVETYFRWTEVMHYSRVIGTGKEQVWFEVSHRPFKIPRRRRKAVAKRTNYIDYLTPPIEFSNGSRADYLNIGVVLP